ncbi:MAG: phenylalanine--tRNA ligase subunit alpha [Flavobacteriales bacterium]
MKEKIDALLQEVEQFRIQSKEDLESFRIRFLGTKNVLKDLFTGLKDVASESKKEVGLLINDLKNKAQEKFDTFNASNENAEVVATGIDFSRPAEVKKLGSIHPLSLVTSEIIDIFKRIGFIVADGPEIEDDWHNFTALNTPEEHPARDMQDTFFIQQNPDVLLRTQTSSIQIRYMEKHQPPIRVLTPGRVYRNEAISARAHCFFHQIEGLYVAEKVSFADLKQTLDFFAKELFGEASKIRMRPSFFPFTEPSAEVDVSCSLCGGKGCNVCKYSGWLEILGCGMVDPNVLKNCGIDPEKYTGFAFGMGVERIAQLKYRVKDLRLYSENDVRFLEQFKSSF